MRARVPFECCRFVIATPRLRKSVRSRISRIASMPGSCRVSRDARTAFLMEPREHLAVMNEVDRRKFGLRASYHSHPDHYAYFSETDRAQACSFDPSEPDYPDTIYIVVSVRGESCASGRVRVGSCSAEFRGNRSELPVLALCRLVAFPASG